MSSTYKFKAETHKVLNILTTHCIPTVRFFYANSYPMLLMRWINFASSKIKGNKLLPRNFLWKLKLPPIKTDIFLLSKTAALA